MVFSKALSAPNALARYADLPGTLDEIVGRLVRSHGADAVKSAVKKATVKRKGRKPERDWIALKPWIEMDAQDWLDGCDPFALRSNYFLANQIAASHPGQSTQATHRRVMAKLAKRRKWMAHVAAWHQAEDSRPFADYFRAVDALAELDVGFAESMHYIADMRRGMIERYKNRFGEPTAELTLEQIKEALQTPEFPQLDRTSGGLLGQYLK
ncbi:MAG: hypothetical protein ABL907_00115 [Hyphomicrobium sp.]